MSYVQGSAQALVIIRCPHVSATSLSKGWGFRGAHRPTCFAAMYLVSLGLAWVERHGCLVYKYRTSSTWSIGCFAA